jgi:hypothetical protein
MIKEQPYNRQLLQASWKNIDLYDHETIVNASDQVDWFWYAGLGAYNTIRAFGINLVYSN